MLLVVFVKSKLTNRLMQIKLFVYTFYLFVLTLFFGTNVTV
jgi:hypothetical protein